MIDVRMAAQRGLLALIPVLVAAAPAAAQFPLSVPSSDGRDIVFERPPERIVAFDSAVVEILFAIGEGQRIVATHDFVSYPPEAVSIPRLGDAFNMDIEAVVALEPDLVAVFYDAFVDHLERAGLKVLYRQTLSDDFTRVADTIRLWGRITDRPEGAAAAAQRFEQRVAAITVRMAAVAAGPRVFQDVGGFWTPGTGTLMQEVFELLKLENIAAGVDGYAQLSPEIIAARDPQLIITATPDTYDHPGLQQVAAVRNDAFCVLSSDALSIAGPRFVDGIDELARCVYPEVH